MEKYPLPINLLPHEDPILFVDKILDFKMNEYLIAEKFVDADNAFFTGHFPGYKLLPGVILTEALFQTCSLYNRLEMMERSKGLSTDSEETQQKNSTGRAVKIDNFVFKQEVRPETKIHLIAKFVKRFMNFSVFDCMIKSDGKLVAKGQLTTYILGSEKMKSNNNKKNKLEVR